MHLAVLCTISEATQAREMAGLLISILSGTAVADIRHHPTPLHTDTNEVGVIGDTLIQYGKVEGFAALIIGDVEYEILPHSSFRVPVGALHGTFGRGIREVTAIDSVTGLSVGGDADCSSFSNPNCKNESAANINEVEYYLCCNFKSFTIPTGVTSIGVSTFQHTGLRSLVIPASVTSIGNDAFLYCENLTTITWDPSENATIGEGAFAYSGLTSFNIPSTVSQIEDFTFEYTLNLTSISIPNSVTHIGDYAFERSGLPSVSIPNSVTSIGESAFYRSQLSSVTIPASVTSIGEDTFYESQLSSVTIPASVTSIGDSAFSYTPNLRSWQIYSEFNDSYVFFSCGCDFQNIGSGKKGARICPTSGPSFVCDGGPCAEEDDSGTEEDDSGTDTGLMYGLIAGGVVIFGVGVAALVYTKFGRSISGQSISGSL